MLKFICKFAIHTYISAKITDWRCIQHTTQGDIMRAKLSQISARDVHFICNQTTVDQQLLTMLIVIMTAGKFAIVKDGS